MDAYKSCWGDVVVTFQVDCNVVFLFPQFHGIFVTQQLAVTLFIIVNIMGLANGLTSIFESCILTSANPLQLFLVDSDIESYESIAPTLDRMSQSCAFFGPTSIVITLLITHSFVLVVFLAERESREVMVQMRWLLCPCNVSCSMLNVLIQNRNRATDKAENNK